jgi:hypothetical protein
LNPSVAIVGVTSDEPAANATSFGPTIACVRSQRDGTGDGRTYTIVLEATDAAGNQSQTTITVDVPRLKTETCPVRRPSFFELRQTVARQSAELPALRRGPRRLRRVAPTPTGEYALTNERGVRPNWPSSGCFARCPGLLVELRSSRASTRGIRAVQRRSHRRRIACLIALDAVGVGHPPRRAAVAPPERYLGSSSERGEHAVCTPSCATTVSPTASMRRPRVKASAPPPCSASAFMSSAAACAVSRARRPCRDRATARP